MDAFWQPLRNEDGTITCPSCGKALKAKVSSTPKNPGRSFVGCSKDYGGCGAFGFLDEPWADKGKSAPKRARTAGTNLVGPIAAAPNATDTRLAELAAKIDQLVTSVEVMGRTVSELSHKIK